MYEIRKGEATWGGRRAGDSETTWLQFFLSSTLGIFVLTSVTCVSINFQYNVNIVHLSIEPRLFKFNIMILLYYNFLYSALWENPYFKGHLLKCAELSQNCVLIQVNTA